MILNVSRDADSFNQKFLGAHRILGKGVYMSTDPKITHYNGNILCIGGTGTGKGYSFFKPNILKERNSMIIYDPAGVYYDDCGEILKKDGFLVKQLVPGTGDADSYPDWSQLQKEKTVLFIKASQNEEGAKAAGALFSDMIAAFMDIENAQSWKNEVTIFLDEAANAGEIKDFARFLAIAPYRNISCIAGIQSITQIQTLYQEQFRQVIAGFSTTVYLGGHCPETLTYICDLAGVANVGGRCGAVLSPKEIAGMDPDECLIFVRGERPLLAQKYRPDRADQ